MTGAAALIPILWGGGGGPGPNPGTDDLDHNIPYPMDTTRPFSAPQPIATDLGPPTTTLAGSAMHPSVFDAGVGNTFGGYRWWMGTTPYSGGEAYENPCIIASNDCVNWSTPAGLTNPIDPAPAGNPQVYNSDTHLALNPDTGLLHLYWRTANEIDNYEILWESHTSNGVTWSPKVVMVQTGAASGVTSYLCPTIIRLGPGDWRMYTWSAFRAFTAPGPTGPWTLLGNCTGYSAAWHGDIKLGLDGLWYGLGSVKTGTTVTPITSRDGIAWTVGASPIITPSAPTGAWDSTQLYRPCLLPSADGTTMRVWYSANNQESTYFWRTGYVRIPLTEWPTPP